MNEMNEKAVKIQNKNFFGMLPIHLLLSLKEQKGWNRKTDIQKSLLVDRHLILYLKFN